MVTTPAAAPNSTYSKIPGFPADDLLSKAKQADYFVAARVVKGACSVELIADTPPSTTLSQDVMDAVVDESALHGMQAVCREKQLMKPSE